MRKKRDSKTSGEGGPGRLHPAPDPTPVDMDRLPSVYCQPLVRKVNDYIDGELVGDQRIDGLVWKCRGCDQVLKKFDHDMHVYIGKGGEAPIECADCGARYKIRRQIILDARAEQDKVMRQMLGKLPVRSFGKVNGS